MNKQQTFGCWLKHQRRLRDLTQTALAQQVGCSPETVRKIEAAKLRPSRQLAAALLAALAIPSAKQPRLLQLARCPLATGTAPSLADDLSNEPRVPSHASGLPPITSLIGRDHELCIVTMLLVSPTVRLVTIVGPPGVGKTQLALHAAATTARAFADGLCGVALDACRDASEMVAAIAHELGVVALGGEPLLDPLRRALHQRPLLLLLDTLEHIRDAALVINALLAAAPQLTILATSRAPLHLSAEHQVALAPFAPPPPSSTLDVLQAHPAVALFVERARTVHHDFALHAGNAAAVAAICTRLDGLPLAIALAAARVKVLSPTALYERLADGLSLLVGGSVDAPERQRTMPAAIAWSYTLLDPRAQALFRRLSVFVGGCGVDAAGMCASNDEEPPVTTFEQLSALVDQGLLQCRHDHDDDEPRFSLLSPLRAFGWARLVENDEVAWMQQRHADYYVRLAETAASQLQSQQQGAWLSRLVAEAPDIAAAFAWTQGAAGDRVVGVRLTCALALFWELRGELSTARQWLEQALRSCPALPQLRAHAYAYASHFAQLEGDYMAAKAHAEASLALLGPDTPAPSVARALVTLAWSAQLAGDYGVANAHYLASLRCARICDDVEQELLVLDHLAHLAASQGAFDVAAARIDEELRRGRQHDHLRAVARALTYVGHTQAARGNVAGAEAVFAEGLALSRMLAHSLGVARALNNLGELARLRGNTVQAIAYLQESEAILRGAGQRELLATVLHNLGQVALAHEDVRTAAASFAESLRLGQELGDMVSCALDLPGVAGIALAQEQAERPVHLLACAHAFLQARGVVIYQVDCIAFEHYQTAARLTLGPARFAAAWDVGLALPLDEALAIAGEVLALPMRAGNPEHDLSPREVEVLRLVAQGLTNGQVAAKLIISPRTVNTHLNRIYSKLGVASRSAATRFCVERGLA